MLKERLRVCFACNDPDNGLFTGRATMASIESLYRIGRYPWDASLAHDDWSRGASLTVDFNAQRLLIHRVWFPFKGHKSWFGNWCWEAFDFDRRTGGRLVELMRRQARWHCEHGPSRFYHWWNFGHPVLPVRASTRCASPSEEVPAQSSLLP